MQNVRQAGIWDSLGAAVEVAAPTIAKGVIVRRPKMVAVAARLGLDARAVRRMQKLRRGYGDNPLMLKGPGRPRVVLLAPHDVKRVLDQTPEPFAPASGEKRAALEHFEPKVALVSHGAERAERRSFNEQVLEMPRSIHSLAAIFAQIVDEEIGLLLQQCRDDGLLDWDRFFTAWHKIVRRVVLGDGARDDHALTKMLTELRGRANWAFFRSQNEDLRDRFHDQLNGHLERAEADSLAELIATVPTSPMTAPSHQVAQWFFAFDPAGMATFRALGLLATHPEAKQLASEDILARTGRAPALPILRATLLESLRLWPTTPAILRQTTRQVEWESGTLPAHATIMIFAPFFHRDDERIDFAHRFTPDVWLKKRDRAWPLVPFSDGPGLCPARNLVPLIASLTLARLLRGNDFDLRSKHGLDRQKELPGTLDNYQMKFSIQPHRTAPRAVPAKAGAD